MAKVLFPIGGLLLVAIGCFIFYTLYLGFLDGQLVGKTSASTADLATQPVSFWFLAIIYAIAGTVSVGTGLLILVGERSPPD